eukprot:6491494-Amphidinium_carterae.1
MPPPFAARLGSRLVRLFLVCPGASCPVEPALAAAVGSTVAASRALAVWLAVRLLLCSSCVSVRGVAGRLSGLLLGVAGLACLFAVLPEVCSGTTSAFAVGGSCSISAVLFPFGRWLVGHFAAVDLAGCPGRLAA